MRTEYENMLAGFLPALRASAAKMMVEKCKVNQTDAARMLGTTQAAISKYLSEKYSRKVKEMEKSLGSKEVEGFVKYTIGGDVYDAQKAVCRMCSRRLSFKCNLRLK